MGSLHIPYLSLTQWVDKAEPGAWTYASIAVTNGGGIRTDMNKGGEIEENNLWE